MNGNHSTTDLPIWWYLLGPTQEVEGLYDMETILGWLETGRLATDVLLAPEGATAWARADAFPALMGLLDEATEPPPPTDRGRYAIPAELFFLDDLPTLAGGSEQHVVMVRRPQAARTTLTGIGPQPSNAAATL